MTFMTAVLKINHFALWPSEASKNQLLVSRNLNLVARDKKNLTNNAKFDYPNGPVEFGINELWWLGANC